MEHRKVTWSSLDGHHKPASRLIVDIDLPDTQGYIPITSATDLRRVERWCGDMEGLMIGGVFDIENVKIAPGRLRRLTKGRRYRREVLCGLVVSFDWSEDALLCKLTWT